jgi:hypothetical protein
VHRGRRIRSPSQSLRSWPHLIATIYLCCGGVTVQLHRRRPQNARLVASPPRSMKRETKPLDLAGTRSSLAGVGDSVKTVATSPPLALGPFSTQAVPVAQQLACHLIRNAKAPFHPVVRPQHVLVGKNEDRMRPISRSGSIFS